jgi:hypothetical protein
MSQVGPEDRKKVPLRTASFSGKRPAAVPEQDTVVFVRGKNPVFSSSTLWNPDLANGLLTEDCPGVLFRLVEFRGESL